MTNSTVSRKGSVVIPKALREKYGLKPGSRVSFVEYRGNIYLFPVVDDPISAIRGMFAGGPSMAKDLLAERARDREREDAGY
jgi:AbrB family looped-hinge helix DNA binding protein